MSKTTRHAGRLDKNMPPIETEGLQSDDPMPHEPVPQDSWDILMAQLRTFDPYDLWTEASQEPTPDDPEGETARHSL